MFVKKFISIFFINIYLLNEYENKIINNSEIFQIFYINYFKFFEIKTNK